MYPFVYSLWFFQPAGFLNITDFQSFPVHQVLDILTGFFLINHNVDGRHCDLLLFQQENRLQLRLRPSRTHEIKYKVVLRGKQGYVL